MSETVLKIKIDELKTVRLTCGQCKVVSELSIEKFGEMCKELHCPCCGEAFASKGMTDVNGPVLNLANAIAELRTNKLAKIEFVIPVPNP